MKIAHMINKAPPIIIMVLALTLLSCSSEEPPAGEAERPAATDQQMSETAQPEVSSPEAKGKNSLHIVPDTATYDTKLGVEAKGFDISNARVIWMVNGVPASTYGPYEYDVGRLDAGKGDVISAKAIIDEEIEVLSSNEVTVKNTPPELIKVDFSPKVFKVGDTLGLAVEASDPDGDPVTLSYEWQLNGEPAGTDSSLGRPLKRGDAFSVRVKPYDGESYGRQLTLQREVGNFPPVIEEKYDDFTFDGKTYTYQVRATDPDGDVLSYTLVSGPKGMAIDSKSGLVSWQVPEDFLGTAEYVVAVSDGQDGETRLSLSFTLADQEEQGKQKEEQSPE